MLASGSFRRSKQLICLSVSIISGPIPPTDNHGQPADGRARCVRIEEVNRHWSHPALPANSSR